MECQKIFHIRCQTACQDRMIICQKKNHVRSNPTLRPRIVLANPVVIHQARFHVAAHGAAAALGVLATWTSLYRQEEDLTLPGLAAWQGEWKVCKGEVQDGAPQWCECWFIKPMNTIFISSLPLLRGGRTQNVSYMFQVVFEGGPWKCKLAFWRYFDNSPH